MKILNKLIAILLIFSLVSCTDKSTSAVFDKTSDISLKETSDWSNFQYKIDTDGHVEKIMKDLCSETYLGRVVGTKENEKTQKYIKDYFIHLNILPFDNNYYISNNDGLIPLSENTNNVAAIIKGTDSSKAVYITAHFDHINDCNNNPLSGAIDNASGVAVLLETAHKVKKLTTKKQLDMDVIFVAFNAEELGLLGSQNFFNKYYNNYLESYNINIDCVAQKNCNTLSMGNDDSNSETLYKAMRETFDKENVIYDDSLYATKNNIRYGTSDHIVIRKYGAPSLVLGDSTIIDVVHTNKDNLDNIDYSDLEKLSDALSKFLISNNGITFNK